jgi:hypothetical protein
MRPPPMRTLGLILACALAGLERILAGQQASYAYEVRYLTALPGPARTTAHRQP